MKALPTSELEDLLTRLSNTRVRLANAMQPLYVLLRDRRIRPDTRHYKAIIQSNSDPEHGTSKTVRKLLVEMEKYNIPVDAGPLRAALLALAVHPDYLLRQDVLRALRDRWVTLSEDDWHYVVAGLIREHQFELALDHVAHMERKRIVVKDWLHSLLIYNLCEFNEFDLVRELMEARLNQGHVMTRELRTYVLDSASKAQHYELTSFIWRRIVELKNAAPPRGICEQVLEVAARHGDTQLKNAVLNMLEYNELELGYKDFLSLVRGHLAAGDLYAAFEICSGTARGARMRCFKSIRVHCRENNIHPRDVWNTIKALKASGKVIQLEYAALVIELCEKAAARDPFVVDDGVNIYKGIYALCGRNPTLPIFNSLLAMCRAGNNVQSAVFFVKEMAKLGLVPNGETFEHLLFLCLKTGNFKSAYLYLDDLYKRGFKVRIRLRNEMFRLCAESNDEYAVKLLEHKEHPQFGKTAAQRERYKRQRTRYKERRKEKRKTTSIVKAGEEEGWEDYEPSLSTPEDLVAKAGNVKAAVGQKPTVTETQP
ncbi:hypothetical protein BDW75DRAFT_232921 [Aspergillus navahoensis]